MDESGQVEQKVYVALPERLNDGKNTLSWVLNNFSNATKIIITHVHIPAQMIPMMGTKFPANQLSPHQVNSYRQEVWEKAENYLNDYLIQCSKAKFRAEKLMFVSNDVAHGLVELVSLHCMSNLVMGAASDRRYSRGMSEGNIADICTKLQAALVDAAKYRVQLNEETCKRERAEMDLASLIQKAEEMQNTLLKEKQEMEFLHKEIEMCKSRLDLLQEENKKLQEERNIAVKELEELRNGAGCGSYGAFSEFSLLELQQATDKFSDSHKIGEGGFGCVYKGFLRNTMVAIKMLHPESLQGRPEFEQEVTSFLGDRAVT
ncbi:U-box domain-containing protein 33 [Carex littledalei]|uniref:RING-type E3 ubiquitin transferase n=1 Tax=Carex littledalei TaxID=544730 RepID=A0A833QM92_9POAL|nr:U-box domain-containing protein 33 [Carex littledalei]